MKEEMKKTSDGEKGVVKHFRMHHYSNHETRVIRALIASQSTFE